MLLLVPLLALGQDRTAAGGPARKQARAVSVPERAIQFDGRLDDLAWQGAPALSDFVQKEPAEGAAPTDRMEVRFVYDGDALYVGARMYGTVGGPPQDPMSRRDEGGQAEYLQVELDTYLDRRTAHMFGVTAAGVRLDHFHSRDDEGDADSGYDPVWQARTHVDAEGWSAEFRVPFTQLRFNDIDEQVWGLNIKRWRPSINEEVYWVLVGRIEEGWASRFGDLHGISRVRPSRRLELLPYVAGASRINGDRDENDPFDDGRNLAQRVGMDAKVGLGPNLTLETTVNPDFGQVEADPAEVNLSAFETFFSERRPFFLEGTDLLQAATNNFFYSRRIGARPGAPADGDYVSYPSAATILGAAKITGRLQSGTSIGLLGAATDQEFARASVGPLVSRTRVAPRALWAVGRVEQELNDQGSTAGLHLTAMHRGLSEGDPLAALMTRNAFTASADTVLRFADRTYEAEMSAGFSYVDGAAGAIERIQRSNVHLLHRPDSGKVRFDPTRESLSGMQFRSSFEKIAGRHWLWGGNILIESPEFEPNDLGRLSFAGDIQSTADLTYRETQPGPLFRSYDVEVRTSATSYYDLGLGERRNIGGELDVTWLNFWETRVNASVNLRGQDAQQARGGPSMGTPLGWGTGFNLSNNNASRVRFGGGGYRRQNENGDLAWGSYAFFSARPTTSLRLSFDPEYNQEINHRQYVTTRDGGRPETFGRRYIFGTIDRSTLNMQIRASYVFKPDLTLDVYLEPFAASGRYLGFGELLAPQSRLLLPYGADGVPATRRSDGSLEVAAPEPFTIANRNFNVQSFRSNVVLRWEWRAGSTLYVVWQQDRSDEQTTGEHVGAGDLFGSFSVPGDNIFAVKTTLWISP